MLSQASGYAATALAYIASLPTGALVKDVANATQIPAPYLAKIIQVLAKKGIVKTQRGIGGGVTLARTPQEISLHEVCVALDDPVVIPRCMLGTAQCSDDRACPAHDFWKGHRARFYTFLHGTSIADLEKVNGRLRYRMLPPHEISRLVSDAQVAEPL